MTGWRERGVRAALCRDQGRFVAGDFQTVPAEVSRALEQHEHRPPGLMRPMGPRHGPPPDDDQRDHGPPDFLDLMAMTDGGPGDPARRQSDGDRPGGERLFPAREATSAVPMEKIHARVRFATRLLGGACPWASFTAARVHGGGPPSPLTLLLASNSLRGGGLFFDYTPWLALGGALVLVSVLLWLPFVPRSDALRWRG